MAWVIFLGGLVAYVGLLMVVCHRLGDADLDDRRPASAFCPMGSRPERVVFYSCGVCGDVVQVPSGEQLTAEMVGDWGEKMMCGACREAARRTAAGHDGMA